jgi:hypothetical protein
MQIVMPAADAAAGRHRMCQGFASVVILGSMITLMAVTLTAFADS